MLDAQPRWTDEQIETWVGSVLRWGVVVAAAFALVGTVLYIHRYGARMEDYRVFHGVPSGLDSVPGVVKGALTGHSRWIIQLGLLLLIATPVARVALSLIAFLLQRDHMYVVITAIVLGVLIYSLSA